jgi:hypothetical protein
VAATPGAHRRAPAASAGAGVSRRTARWRGRSRLPARTFSTLLSLEPAIAAMAGAALLDQQLTPMQWAAILAIIVAAAGTAVTVQPAAEAEPLAN